MTQVFLINGSTSPWATPTDWDNTANTVELVGCGGNGAAGSNGGGTSFSGGSGGGGGAYQKRSNLTLAGNNPFRVPAGGGAVTTRFGNDGAAGTNFFGAQFGVTGVALAAGAGGSATAETGGTPPGSGPSGFAGGTGSASAKGQGASGGGGAGGPIGAGKASGSGNGFHSGGGGGGSNGNLSSVGLNATGTTVGGAGGQGTSGAGSGAAGIVASQNGTDGTIGGGGGGGAGNFVAASIAGAGGLGGSDTAYDGTHGAGGGGGGGGDVNAAGTGGIGGNGGSYGGGAGGGGSFRSAGGAVAAGGTGAGGLIAITYTPVVAGPMPFTEVTRPNPRGSVYPIDLRSITAWYNLNLIGKDALVPGKIYTELPKGPLYHIQFRTWTWQYNANLIGKDELPVGEIVVDRPTLTPKLLQTWIQSINLALTVAPVAPFNQEDWPLPRAALRATDLSTWLQSTKLLLPVPFNESDWPLTPAPSPLSKSYATFFNPNLIGQDAMTVGKIITDRLVIPPVLFQTWINTVSLALTAPEAGSPFNQEDWPLTPAAGRASDLRTWIDQTKLLLAVPFKQTDWPNPAPKLRQALSYTASFPLVLIGQDAMVPGKPLTDLPPQPVGREVQLRTWIQTTDIAYFVIEPLPFNQYNWPINTGPKQPTQIFTFAFNKNLHGQDRLPFRQQHWPLPAQRARQPDLITWIDRAKSYLQPPHRQRDWSLPVRRINPSLSYIATFPRTLVGADRLPFRQQDWPIPRDPRRVSSYTLPTAIWLYYQTVNLPFNQYSWPLPRQPAPLWMRYHFEVQGNNLLPYWVSPIPPVPDPTPPSDSRIAYNSGNEWQQIDRIKEPGPVGWR